MKIMGTVGKCHPDNQAGGKATFEMHLCHPNKYEQKQNIMIFSKIY